MLPASFSSLGGCCTQLSTFPQLQVNQWIESQLASRLPPNRLPPSTRPISLDHGLQMYLQTRSITASKCISKLTRSRPPSVSPDSLDYGLQVHLWVHYLGVQVQLQTRSITASKCITELTRPRPPSASPNSLDPGLKVHLWVQSISVSKCISNTLDQVHLQGATAVVRRYRGKGGGQSDGEYIFGGPRSR